VLPEVTGLLVPPREPNALAAAIGRLLADPALLARMGQAARKHALNHFDERTVFARVAEAYRRLVAPLPGAGAGRGRMRA
jgi:glycosyltransferase involved in cell wall biosynthesis